MLLQHFNLPLQVEAGEDVCTLHFNGRPDLHLIGSAPDGYINLMCEAGLLPNLQAVDTLLGLLMLNRCDSTEYSVGVTLHRQSGTVIVCSRQRWAALDLAAAKLLLQCMHGKVDAVQRLLEKPEMRAKTTTNSAMARRLLASHSVS